MNIFEIKNKLNLGVPLTEINLRVTFYSRVSTEHEEQINSLINQNDHFESYIKSNPKWTYIKGYIDEGKSGTNDTKRENFLKMINDAKQNKFDLILTKEISRFSRNTLDSIKYTRELLNYNVFILFVNDNINTALPDAELRLTIMASMAQDEIRRLSERVKFGMHEAMKKGNILGNNMLYGYKKNNKTGSLIINKKEAEIVKYIFNSFTLKNESINKIAINLNNKNIKTNMNNNWTITTIKRMITNPKYKGYYCAKKSEVINYLSKKIIKFDEKDWICYKDYQKIPPIIPEKIWDIANQKLKLRKQHNKNIYLNRYPLSAKLICNHDNHIYHRRKNNRNNEISWICSNYINNKKEACDSIIIKEKEIYKIINNIINRLKINFNDLTNILINLYKKHNYNNIKIKLNNQILLDKLINILINKIEIKNENDNVYLNIILNTTNESFIIENTKYTFKRGYNSKYARKYQIKYIVNTSIKNM